jgi:hypothetical protein
MGLRVNKMNGLLRTDRSKAPHILVDVPMQGHRYQCEGFPRDKISELIFFPGDPSHKPLKRSFSVSSVSLATFSPVERERARDILEIL